MGPRVHALLWIVVLSGVAVAGPPPRTRVTVWTAPSATSLAYGGLSYGGYAPTTGALITEQREVDVASGSDVRISGIASTVDAASVQLRDLTEPTATITEQRLIPGATTPTEILARHVGDTITVITAKGESSGMLRAVDEQVLVLEVGSGDQRRLQMMRRDGYIQDVRLPAGAALDKASLVWRLATKQPGKHAVEVSYRADGIAWTADYLAVLDDAGTTVDFSAWATIKNATTASFDSAELTLVSAGTPSPISPTGHVTPLPTPFHYKIAAPVRLAAGQSVQVALMPPRVGAKARTVISYEAMPDPSPGFQTYANTDCQMFNGAGLGSGHAEVTVELEVAGKEPLPEGRVRMFRRHADRVEVVSEEPIRTGPGIARIRLAPNQDITGERSATCTYDETAHTVAEKVTVKLENHAKHPADVVIREYLWRWPVFKLEAEDTKGVRAGAQTQEYRVALPAGGKRSVTYSVVYTAW